MRERVAVAEAVGVGRARERVAVAVAVAAADGPNARERVTVFVGLPRARERVAVAVTVGEGVPIARERERVAVSVGVTDTAAREWVVDGVEDATAEDVPSRICPQPADAASAKKKSLRIISLSYPYNAEYSYLGYERREACFQVALQTVHW